MTFQLSQILCEGLQTIRDVLVHDRARWGPLLSHGRQYESWWKAEFLTALEAWTWESRIAGRIGVWSEVKPRDLGLGESSESVDILIAPATSGDESIPTATPRLWIELKERGTWWQGGPSKALGKANRGLHSDLEKWAQVPWTDSDAVIACHITSHRASNGASSLPDRWSEAFDDVARHHALCLSPLSVGYPVPGSSDVLWCTIHFFEIHVPPFGGQGSGSSIDLRAKGIGQAEAANLRARLLSFSDDWDREDMNVYDEL